MDAHLIVDLDEEEDDGDEDCTVLLDRKQLDEAIFRRSRMQDAASTNTVRSFPLNSTSDMEAMDNAESSKNPLSESTTSIAAVDATSLNNISPSRSSFKSFVRRLTPKRHHPKPILVRAGFQRETDDRDLKVTFEVPHTSGEEATAEESFWKKSCAQPLIPVAGTLSFIGGISFGYDIGIISGILQPLREHFRLTCLQEQVLVGCLIGGALIVSICGGPWIDKCGRRRAILISCSIFILGSGLSAISPNLDMLAAGRLLQGFGMSMSTIAECIYVSEIAPKEKRGLMVGLNELGITFGFVMAFFVGFIFHGVANSWRAMMAIGAAPTLIQLLGTYFLLPPSPREKMMNKSDKEAILILENLRGSRNEAMNEFAAIRHSLVVEESYGTLSLFRSADNMLFRLLVGFSLVFLQQISGQPNILYYSSVVFEQMGFASKAAALATLGLGIVKVASTAVALSITDRKGRRFFLLLGCLMMAGSISVVGISTLANPPPIQPPCDRIINATFPQLHSTTNLNSNPPFLNGNSPAVNQSRTLHPVQLAVDFCSLMVYIVGYSISFGPMTWLVLSELYPSGVKGRAISFANIINWATSLTVTLTFLKTMTALTPGGTFLIFGVVNLFGALYIYLVVPETKGKSLERISYELRTTRPKQRFDENLSRLIPWLKSRRNRPGVNHNYERVTHTSIT